MFANQFCHGCMRVKWNQNVIAEEEAHKRRHELGECSCEVIFDRGEGDRRERERGLMDEGRERFRLVEEEREKARRENREREVAREREREVRALREGGEELEAMEQRREREGSGSAMDGNGNGNGRARIRAQGKGRGATADARGANVAGAADKTGDKNSGEERGEHTKKMGESNGDAGMMPGMNGENMMGTAPPRYTSPRPNDPASSHECFHIANNHIGGAFEMNPITGVMNGIPISNPPRMTSSSQMHGDMMIIPPSPRMSNMGVYPVGHPILANQRTDSHPYGMHAPPQAPPAGPPVWQSPHVAPSTYSDGNSSGIYPGNHYSWSNPPNAPAGRMDHRGPYSQGQARVQYPTPPDFSNPIAYAQHHQIEQDAQRNAYNYVGYYMERPPTNGSSQTRAQGAGQMADHLTTGSFIRAPTFSTLPGGAPGAGMVWHSSHNSAQAFPPLPPQIPYFGDLTLAAPSAPRNFNESPPVLRRNGRNSNAQRNTIHRSRTSQSVGQSQMQETTTTSPAQIGSHATTATTATSGTTRGQPQMAHGGTPAAMNISILRTPRVVSSVPRPNSAM